MISDSLKAKLLDFCTDYDPHERAIAAGVQGGHGRGKADQFSDIDMVFVFAKREDREGMLTNSVFFNNEKYDIRHLVVEGLNKMYGRTRYIYAHETYVLYDKTGEFGKIIGNAHMTEDERCKIIVYVLKKLEKRGITYSGYSKWRGLHKKMYWLARGDILSAHMQLTEGIELIATLIFALNNAFLPSPKCRYNILQGLEWLPKNFTDLFVESMNVNADVTSFEKRQTALCQLLKSCVDYAEKTLTLPDDIDARYKSWFHLDTDNPEINKEVTNGLDFLIQM